MMDYLAIGFGLWIFANAFGLNLGPEYILSLPVIMGVLFFVFWLDW